MLFPQIWFCAFRAAPLLPPGYISYIGKAQRQAAPVCEVWALCVKGEEMIDPGIYTSHVGYLPDAAKIAVLSDAFTHETHYCIRDVEDLEAVVYRGELCRQCCPWGDFVTADFSPVTKRGFYQVVPGSHRTVGVKHPHASFPFLIAPDAYEKTMRMAFEYFRCQRCGTAVPGYHPACHLDDARLRGSGEYIDAAGAWHDAGDVRKWAFTCVFYVYAMLEAAERYNPPWTTGGSSWGDLLEEARWGNDYLLRLQNPHTAEVYNDVAGGVNGDNSDCRWTDNIARSGDERFVNERIVEAVQWMFIAAQAKCSRLFRTLDRSYADTCRDAAMRCYETVRQRTRPSVAERARATLACLELWRTDGAGEHLDAAWMHAAALLQCQETAFGYGQRRVRGFFFTDETRIVPYKHWAFTGLPLYALCELSVRAPAHAGSEKLRRAIDMHVHEYVAPLIETNPFGLLPYGLYVNEPIGSGRCHPLAGRLRYRYFVWGESKPDGSDRERPEMFEHGQNSHILSYAGALLLAERVLQTGVARRCALRQLEWVMGCNPRAVCFMTGAGVNSPYPHSRFVGMIPGGIMNGFNGGPHDRPFVHAGNTLDWETTEYWGAHNANYLWALSILYGS